jgi:hypothetical protein
MNNIEETAMDIFLPVLESAMIYASHYCKACGRSTVTSHDVQYGWKYAARVTLGKKIGSFFPEIYEEEDEDSESEDEILEVAEEDEPFTRYDGVDELYTKMNEVFDEWDAWEPFSPAEKMIKNAIDSQKDGRLHTE